MHSTFEYQVIFTNGNINGDLYPIWRNVWHPVTFAFLPCLKTLIIMYSYNWIVQNRTGIVIIFQLFTCNPHLMNKCADQVKSQINSLSLQERSSYSTFVFKIQSPIPTLFINNLPCYLCLWWNKRVWTQNKHPPTHPKNDFTIFMIYLQFCQLFVSIFRHYLNPHLKFVWHSIIPIINLKGFIDIKNIT